MKLSEAVREWKRSITTNTEVEYVLALRADINAFSDAAQALEEENAELRELVQYILDENYGDDWFAAKAEELGLEARY